MSLFRYLNRKFTSDAFDAHAGQYAAWAVSMLVLVLGIFKLVSLDLTEAELFLGMLLVFAVMLLVFNLGMLLPLTQAVKQMKKDRERGD